MPCAVLCCVVQQIIDVNNLLRELLQRGNPTPNLMENWDFLQVGLGFCVWRTQGVVVWICRGVGQGWNT